MGIFMKDEEGSKCQQSHRERLSLRASGQHTGYTTSKFFSFQWFLIFLPFRILSFENRFMFFCLIEYINIFGTVNHDEGMTEHVTVEERGVQAIGA